MGLSRVDSGVAALGTALGSVGDGIPRGRAMRRGHRGPDPQRPLVLPTVPRGPGKSPRGATDLAAV